MRIATSTILAAIFLASCVPMKTVRLTEPYRDNPIATLHHFVPIEEGRVYSSASPNPEFLEWLAREKGVRELVSLRGPLDPKLHPIVERYGMRVHAFHWSAKHVPPENELRKVFTLMKDAPRARPILIFCKAGVDRTGYARAYYRVFGQGWNAAHALREFNGLFHIPNVLDEDLKQKFRKFSDPTDRPPTVSHRTRNW